MTRVATCLLVSLAGCATVTARPAFDPRFADNRPEPTRTIAQALSQPDVAPSSSPLLVATNDPTEDAAGRSVIAMDLPSGALRWRAALDALSRPEILPTLVICSARDDGEQVIALDRETGEVRWRHTTEELSYIGAAGDSSLAVYTLSVGAGGGAERRSLVRAVDASTGTLRWEHRVDGVVAAPVVKRGFAFIPWDRQNLVVLRTSDGREAARLRSTDDVIAWAHANAEGVFYGGRGAYRFDDQSFTGRREASTYRAAPVEDLPTRPLFVRDTFFPIPGRSSARDRIRLFAEPGPPSSSAPISIVGSTVYYVYFRFVFAFDPDGPLRWARVLEHTVVGGHALEDGFLAVSRDGTIRHLSAATGNDRWLGSLETAWLASASLAVDGFVPPGADGEPRNLRGDLRQIAADPDNGLVAARAYAIEQLATSSDDEVTRELLELFQRPSMPRTLRSTITQQITSRETGAEHLAAALDRRFDFLEETAAPPLALIAPALARMNATASVAALSRHLLDHETPFEALPAIAEAIVKLGVEEAAPALLRFLRLYHRDSTFAEDSSALRIIASGLFSLDDRAAKAGMETIASQPGTPSALAEHIRELAAVAAARSQDPVAEAADSSEPAIDAPSAETPTKPPRLTQETVDRTVIDNLELLRECVADERLRNPQLSQVRFTFIINRDGSSENWRFSPNREEFVRCAEPKVTEIAFPPFQARRMPAVSTINLRPHTPVPPPEPLFAPDAPWWVRYRARNAVEAGPLPTHPWWERRAAAQTPAGETETGETSGADDSNADSSGTPDGSEETIPEWWLPQAD